MEQLHFDLQPVLENDLLLLRPLKEEDFESLYEVSSDPLVWAQHPNSDRYKKEVFEELFKDAILSGAALTVIDKKTGDIIGSSRFHRLEIKNAIEIGWTFLSRAYWGGLYNNSLKSLMINHAFNFVPHVLFYVDQNNIRSCKAMEKIGGEQIITLEGQFPEKPSASSIIYKISRKEEV